MTNMPQNKPVTYASFMPHMPQEERRYAVSRRYRNRRIGGFLKELDLTEGRSTGIPKFLREMLANGSPAPEFESDDDRLSYLVRLPGHPQAETDTGQADPFFAKVPSVRKGSQNCGEGKMPC